MQSVQCWHDHGCHWQYRQNRLQLQKTQKFYSQSESESIEMHTMRVPIMRFTCTGTQLSLNPTEDKKKFSESTYHCAPRQSHVLDSFFHGATLQSMWYVQICRCMWCDGRDSISHEPDLIKAHLQLHKASLFPSGFAVDLCNDFLMTIVLIDMRYGTLYMPRQE